MQNQTPLEPDIIRKLKANDEQALRSVYIANYSKIEKYILDNSGTRDDAKDIYQETFLAVWRSIQGGTATFTGIDKLQGYMYRIAQFKWTDQLRANKKQNTGSLPEDGLGDLNIEDTASEQNEYIDKVRKFYATMEEPCKDILNRFYYLKQSMSDIAAKYSWTDATAKNNKYRCLQRLRQMVLKNQ